MKTYHVEVVCNGYFTIEAENDDEATIKAGDLFAECTPEFIVWEVEKNED